MSTCLHACMRQCVAIFCERPTGSQEIPNNMSSVVHDGYYECVCRVIWQRAFWTSLCSVSKNTHKMKLTTIHVDSVIIKKEIAVMKWKKGSHPEVLLKWQRLQTCKPMRNESHHHTEHQYGWGGRERACSWFECISITYNGHCCSNRANWHLC